MERKKTANLPSTPYVLDTTAKKVILMSSQDGNGCEMFRMISART